MNPGWFDEFICSCLQMQVSRNLQANLSRKIYASAATSCVQHTRDYSTGGGGVNPDRLYTSTSMRLIKSAIKLNLARDGNNVSLSPERGLSPGFCLPRTGVWGDRRITVLLISIYRAPPLEESFVTTYPSSFL